MKIYLVQHGEPIPEELNPEKPLSEKGKNDCEKVAALAAKAGIKVNKIYHSGKKRAEETAEIFKKHLMSTGEIEQKEGLAPMDDVSVWKDKLEDGLVLCGHLPFMQKISSLLICGDENKKIVNFKQGGLVCLEQDELGWSVSFEIIPDLL